MAFSAYSLTPSLNTTIGGVSIAEGCPPANLNDAMRQFAADGKALSDATPSVAGLLPTAGGTMTGNITRSGAGPHLYFANSGFTTGAFDFQPTGTARPSSPAEGYTRFYY